MVLDPAILAASLAGEGMDQKAGWSELLREVAEAAAGELLAKTGKKCRVESFEELADECDSAAREFQLKSPAGEWSLQVHDELNATKTEERQTEAQTSSGCVFRSCRLPPLLRETRQD